MKPIRNIIVGGLVALVGACAVAKPAPQVAQVTPPTPKIEETKPAEKSQPTAIKIWGKNYAKFEFNQPDWDCDSPIINFGSGLPTMKMWCYRSFQYNGDNKAGKIDVFIGPGLTIEAIDWDGDGQKDETRIYNALGYRVE